MSYKRQASKLVLTLRFMAFLCENWIWPCGAFMLLSPITPYVLIQGNYQPCTYFGKQGSISVTLPPTSSKCPFIKFIKNEVTYNWLLGDR